MRGDNNKIKVIRGDAWAARLKGQLNVPNVNTAQWMEDHTRIVKSDVHSLAGMIEISGKPCFLKLYYHKTPLHKLQFAMGGGRPVRSFDVALALRAKGVTVPRPHGCLRVPQGMLLLTQGISGEGNLAQLWRAGLSEEEALGLMRRAGDALARLHCRGYAHGDCKWNNLLWDGRRVYLIDLDAARRAALHSPRQARDVARFTLNAEELDVAPLFFEQFLASYLESVESDRDELVKQVMPLLKNFRSRHLKRYGRSGEVLL